MNQDEKPQTINYVKTEKAHVTEHEIVIRGNGRLGSSRNVVLIAEVQGKLLKGNVNLKAGTNFSQGQFLFGIDDTQMRLKLQARKSGFLTMLATALPDLKIDFPDSFKQWESFFQSIDVTKSLPKMPEINSSQGKTYLASKNILGEYYSIQADEELLSKYKVYAPFSGNFIDVYTELGTVVNTGTQIARIIQTGSLEVKVPMSVSETRYVNVNDPADVYVEGEEDPVPGKIVRIGEYINPNTQSVDVFVGVEKNGKVKMFDGMYVEVEIKAGTIPDVVKVPRRAMIDDRHVYVVKDSLLIRQPVTTVLKSEESFFISGVKQNEEVVIEALSNPVDSMVVKPLYKDE